MDPLASEPGANNLSNANSQSLDHHDRTAPSDIENYRDVIEAVDVTDDDEEDGPRAVEIGDRSFSEEALCQAAEKGGGLTLKGTINLGGHMDVTHNNYQDNRVTDKSVHHHHGDVNEHSHNTYVNKAGVIYHQGDLYKTEHVHYSGSEAGGYTQIKDQSRLAMTRDEDVFVETWSFRTALERVSHSGILVLTGAAGTGKSCLARALLRHFDKLGYIPLVLHRFEEWRLHVGGDRKQVVVLEHVWGREEFAPADFRDWANVFPTMSQLAHSDKCVIIITVNDVILDALLLAEIGTCSIFQHAVSLSDSHAAFSVDEKKEMLKKHLARSGRWISDDALSEIVSSEKSGAHFPTSCRQFGEAPDGERTEWEKIFAHSSRTEAGPRTCGAGPKVCVKISPDLIRKSLLKPTKKNISGWANLVFQWLPQYGFEFNDIIWTPGGTVPEDEKHRPDTEPTDTQQFSAQQSDTEQSSKQQNDDNAEVQGKMAPTLCESCRSGDVDSVQALLDSGSDPSAKNEAGSTALHVASLAGHADVVRMLLDHRRHKCPPNVTDAMGWTPLHLACLAGHAGVAEPLVQRGAELEKETSDGVTALHVAARRGHLATVRFLLENGASVDARQSYHRKAYPLHVAAYYGHADAVELLIQFGARAESEDRFGWLPLHYACQEGHAKVVDLLLSHSATSARNQPSLQRQQLRVDCLAGHGDLIRELLQCSVGIREADGKTTVCRSCYLANKAALENLTLHTVFQDPQPNGDATGLILAAQNGHLDAMKSLLRAGACAESRTKDGWTPLHVASYHSHVHIVNLLLEYKSTVDDTHNDYLFTPLHLACRKKSQEAVMDSLLLHGASVDAFDLYRQSPLHYICMNGPPGFLSRLLPKVRDRYSDSYLAGELLSLACRNGQADCVRCLLNWLPNLTRDSPEVHRGINEACSSGKAVVLSALLEHKVFADAVKEPRLENGHTPLHTATEKDFDDIAELLIKYGAPGDKANSEGYTPLLTACEKGRIKVTTLLLVKGSADAKVRNDEGRTALHVAADSGNADVVTLLLEKGSVDTAARDNQGMTALHVAANGCSQSVIRALLRDGSADTNVTDTDGQTALHIAARSASDDVVKILLANSADANALDLKKHSPLMLTPSQKVLETLLASGADVNVQSSDGKTALHTACAARNESETEESRSKKVKLLLDHGARVNVADGEGSTPLHLSCSHGDANILKLLVQHGGTAGVHDKDGNTPLHLACIKGHASVVTALLEAGASDEAVNHDRNTPLHLACFGLQVGVVRLILRQERTFCTTMQNKSGQTPLTVVQSMKLEQPQEAPPSFSSPFFPTPHAMHGARRPPNFSAPQFVSRANPGYSQNSVTALLHQSRMRFEEENARLREKRNAEKAKKIDSRDEILLLFMEHSQRASAAGALRSKQFLDGPLGKSLETTPKGIQSVRENIATPDRDKVTNEDAAVAHKESLKEGKSNTTDSSRTTAASEATRDASNGVKSETDEAASTTQPRHPADGSGDVPPPGERSPETTVCNMDEEVKGEESSSPLHAACYRGDTSSVLSHLSTLTDINFPSRSGRTALHYACAGGHSDIAALLLKLNANVTTRDDRGKTPLHYACWGGHLDTADLLLTQEADVHASDGDSLSALHVAASRGHGIVSAVLLARGAHVNVCDHRGNTPLMLAVLGGHTDVCVLLLNSGADPGTTNKEGQSAKTLLKCGKSPSLDKVFARHKPSKHQDP